MAERLPDFLVIGAPKSGTTSLYHYLRQHPQIFLPVRKELHYFSYEQIAENVAGPHDAVILPALCADRQAYVGHYAGAADFAAVGEISPSYLYYDQVRARIRDELGPLRIVVLLRDPVQKAFSQYMHLVRDGRETLSFHDGLLAADERAARGWSDLWRYAESSLYAERLSRYIDLFGRDRVRVYFFEEFVAEPQAVLSDLFEFLGVERDFRCDTSQVYNRTGRSRSRFISDFLARPSRMKAMFKKAIPERTRSTLRQRVMHWNTGGKPELQPAARAYLEAYFREDRRRLERLLGRALPWGPTAGESQRS